MNIVDSSGWLEYFSKGPNAKKYLQPLKDTVNLIVPVITIYEVFKVVLRERGENDALLVAAAMQRGTVSNLTTKIALAASKLSLQYKLPMADSIILATAQLNNATLWTQDIDFKDIPSVKYFSKD
ncbi:MAG: type II toxin-antitoxin system VapC family toxin [Kiritimatiellia bacterium]